MNTYTRIILILGGLVLMSAVAYYLLIRPSTQAKVISPFFTYSEEEVASLAKLSSAQRFSSSDILRTDDMLYKLIAKTTQEKTLKEETSKVYAYILLAERDFAALSYRVSGKPSGSMDYLLTKVFCKFFPSECDSIIMTGEDDVYSKAVGDLVFKKIEARLSEEKAHTKNFSLLTGEQYWGGIQSATTTIKGVLDRGWFLERVDQFRPGPPPAPGSDAFKEEQRLTREILKNVTQEQKLATVLWTAGPGTKTVPGILIERGTKRMIEQEVSLPKLIFIRSLLAAVLDDANNASYDTKYTYQAKRPFMVDPTLITLMPTPNNPSYPSSQATLATAASVILTHFFPEDRDLWEAQSREAGLSRVWGGIHFMMDQEAGSRLGTAVAQEALKKTGQIDSAN